MRRVTSMCGALAVCAWGLGVSGVAVAAAQTERAVYVSVVDDDGQQVTGLTPADFELKEGGKKYDVGEVSYPSERMKLTVLVEEIMAPDTNIRMGIFELAKQMVPQADIRLVVVGNRNEEVVDYTGDINAIVQALNGFTVRQNRQSGNMVEGILEAANKAKALEASRKAIVAVALETLQAANERAERVLEGIRDSGAVFHAVTLEAGSSVADAAMMGEMTARNQILGDGPRWSGGIREQLRSTQGAVDSLKKVANELSAQYKLSYTLPAGVKTSNRFELKLDHKGADLHAPTRIAQD